MYKRVSPTYLNVFFILVIIFHIFLPIKIIIYPPFSYLGIFFLLFGLFLNIWASQTLKNAGTPIDFHTSPAKLVTSGSFQYSRNPIYLSGNIMLLGLAILMGSLIGFIFPILLVIILLLFYIPVEEDKMEAIFSEEYLKYKNNVRRWF
ncbi:MAG: methyltransferase family protein [Candidatus Kariarchaeaceae archaeon]